jgi:hypothetical protein
MDPERDLTDIEEDLRATADDIAADASELAAIEKTKARTPADDPALLELAKRASELGKKISAKTSSELALATDATAAS